MVLLKATRLTSVWSKMVTFSSERDTDGEKATLRSVRRPFDRLFIMLKSGSYLNLEMKLWCLKQRQGLCLMCSEVRRNNKGKLFEQERRSASFLHQVQIWFASYSFTFLCFHQSLCTNSSYRYMYFPWVIYIFIWVIYCNFYSTTFALFRRLFSGSGSLFQTLPFH